MTPDERRRWESGRDDWRENRWQDHCGNLDCERCHGEIPAGCPERARLRAAFERSILGAAVDLL